MKKFLVIMIALVGFGVSANSQTCESDGPLTACVTKVEPQNGGTIIHYTVKNSSNTNVPFRIIVEWTDENGKTQRVGSRMGVSAWIAPNATSNQQTGGITEYKCCPKVIPVFMQ